MSKKRPYRRKTQKAVFYNRQSDPAEYKTIDLEKLQNAPQSNYVLRLLSVLNDLDSGSSLNDLLSEPKNAPQNVIREKWRNGAVLYLLRMRVGIVYTALKDVVREMKDKVDCHRGQKIS